MVIISKDMVGISRDMVETTSSHAFNYDVFLSFRGTDTRFGFTGNLYKVLCDKGICTFFDDEELKSGEEIAPALVKAIQGSKIAIIVLSKDYASSSFCLDELSTIIHCAQSKGLMVIPVFYKVDPSHVRYQIGSYEGALTKHESRFPMNKLLKWKEALLKVADLSGYHFKEGDGYEYKFIGSIVDCISQMFNHPARLHVSDKLVGLDSQVAVVMWHLDAGTDDGVTWHLHAGSDDGVHMVGIHGMGGIGKSTLARVVYNKLISPNFDGFCFLENMREETNKHGLQHLQITVLSKILGEKDINLTSWREGATIIKDRLQGKKVLLILDDVDKDDQLQAILGRPCWFAPGSRVIITTRNQQLLESSEVKQRYEVYELNKEDALRLLTWKAFKKEKADPTYEEALNSVLTYASGLPLALEVIGSHLSGIPMEEWKSAIEYYKKNSDEGIQGILEVSLRPLQKELKNVFLDIACWLKGFELTRVEYILSALYDCEMKYLIQQLVKKSIIKVDEGRVTMHDLIQDMGRHNDLENSHRKPGKRRRLTVWKDIIEVLKHNKGTDKIEIIDLDVPISDRENIIEWDGNGFKEMANLKILIIKNAKFSEGPKCLPNSLRLLEWWGYPSNCLPSDFQPDKLVKCNLPDNRLTSFELDHSSKAFKNLTVLTLDRCKSLTQLPDLSDFLNLEDLSFKLCDNLVTVHESIGHLSKLKILSAYGCSNLVSFPPIHLTSLEYLNLSSTGLECFPEISGEMESITRLHLNFTPIKELPISFVNLIRLQQFSMYECGSIVKLPSRILMMPELTEFLAQRYTGIKWVKEEENEETLDSIVSSKIHHLVIPGCNLNDDFFSIGFTRFANVTFLNLSGNNFTFIPECIKEFRSLVEFKVCNCKHLQEIRGVPPKIEYLDAVNCKSLNSTTTRMFINKERYDAGMNGCSLPGAWIPGWFDQQSKGPSTSFWFRNEVPADVLCFIITSVPYYSAKVFMNGKYLYNTLSSENEMMEMDHTFIFDLELVSPVYKVALEEEWNHVEVRETSGCKAIGIHVRTSSEDDIRFTDPFRKRRLEEVLNPFKLENNGRLLKRPRFV